MNRLYEESDLLNNPFQCFLYSTKYSTLPIAPHWHYYMELIYVKEGSIRLESSGTEYVVNTGDMFLVHPKVVHAFYKQSSGDVTFLGIKLDISSMTFTSYYTPKLYNIFKSAEKKKKSILIPSSFVSKMKIETIFEQCITEISNKRYGYDIMIYALLYQLLILIIRYWQKDGFKIEQEVFVEEESYDVFNILPYISANLDIDLKVNDIAASCGLSYSHFAKKFQTIYGKSCKEYIEEMRIYKVEELLLFTDFDLTSISQMTGFSDCSHMIKSFKKYKQITPKQFRLQNQAEQKAN